MAFWTPYARDEPLDLSKTAPKSEEVSPGPSYSSHELPRTAPGYVVTYPDPRLAYGLYYQPARSYAPFVPPAVPYVVPSAPYVVTAAPYVVPAAPYVAATISPDCTGSCCLQKPNPPSSAESGLHISDSESLSGDMEYQVFESQAFQGLATRNGGSLVGSNPRMRRAVQTSQSNDSYRRQRERNNLAAKQSRDRRKLREIRLAFQVSFLKKKMAALKNRMAAGVCGRCAGAM